MAEENLAYSTALRLAQEQGFAEPDPTLDVSGADAAQKLSILARLAFQARVDYRDIPCEGIDRLSITDIRFAGELGYVVKLIAMAGLVDGRLGARVAPTLVGKRHALARVGSEFNMIQVTGSAVGDCYFMGRGAGSLPTASSIVADIADIVIGRAQATFKALELWSETVPGPAFDPAVRLTSRFYLRFMIDDRPGTLAQIAGVLGRFGVSIASVIQHDSAADGEGTPVPLIITTHHADETRLREALAETDRLGAVRNPTVCLHLVD
jgi:homoserine dehydrogenase